jgi:hypothetical protein
MNFIPSTTSCALVCMAMCSLAASAHAQYHGILINGYYKGTQVYDPFNAPHAHGHLHLGLPAGMNVTEGAAVINGQLAYFGGSGEWRRDWGVISHKYSDTTYKNTEMFSEVSYMNRRIDGCVQRGNEQYSIHRTDATCALLVWHDNAE